MPKAAYAAMVTHLDRSVGRVLDRLRSRGVAENTLVLFTSDNGPHGAGGYDPAYFDSNGPLRGNKRDLYEGGIRVPQIAWWPGHVEAGTTTDEPSYFADYMDTFAALAGTEPPEETDGVSLAPTLRGEAESQESHEFLYWTFGERQAVRAGRWKAVRSSIGSGPVELYDLTADPDESNDRADDYPDVAERMAVQMEAAHVPEE
jgi:arylsulfatase A-like enzyme